MCSVATRRAHGAPRPCHRYTFAALDCGAVTQSAQMEAPVKLRPMFDRIVIERVSSETRSRGGLFLPDSAQEKQNIGVVIAVGQGRLNEDGSLSPLAVAEGQKVMFGKYAGNEIEIGGEERIVLRESDILGILD
uniref:Co-chaperonin GroES n=1 Tax=uncultured delta proteobacterium HF0010_01J10 TaxID=710820 RepID=E0XQF2_9DELT|nr:co-chaperonin groes (hsp10) [uncultured delta proteobacterium HF0010_01J10]